MGIPERKQREREQRKAMIIDCAMDIFASKGIAATAMDEIAVKAELSKATLYLYFKNKDELIVHAMLRVISSYIQKLQVKMAETDDDLEKLHKVGEAYLEYYHEHPQYYTLLNSTEDFHSMVSPEYEVCQELQMTSLQIWVIICEPISALIQKGVLLPDTIALELGMLLWAGSTGVIGIWKQVEQHADAAGMLQMEAQVPLLHQMHHLNFEQMLRNLWDSIIDSYLNK